MQIKFNIPQAEQVDSSGDFRSRLETSSLVFARSLAVDLWQVYLYPYKVGSHFRLPASFDAAGSLSYGAIFQCHWFSGL